ncbi:MAG: hypothetical protein AB8G23_16200 [Myxococcota bacterium]
MPTERFAPRRRETGAALGSILCLLVLLSGAGAWNYHRNWTAEQTAGPRPFASYASEDLEALRSAYSSEVDQNQARFDSAKRNRNRPQGDVGSIAGNVAQFQKATQSSSAIRQAASHVAAGQGRLSELDRELELRARFGVGNERHLKRLITL